LDGRGNDRIPKRTSCGVFEARLLFLLFLAECIEPGLPGESPGLELGAKTSPAKALLHASREKKHQCKQYATHNGCPKLNPKFSLFEF
jgi:hypothetical protein